MKKPHYKGKGNHSIHELEQLCEQFEEFCHIRQIERQGMMSVLTKAFLLIDDIPINSRTERENKVYQKIKTTIEQ